MFVLLNAKKNRMSNLDLSKVWSGSNFLPLNGL